MYPHSTEKVKPRNKQINKQTNKKTQHKEPRLSFYFLYFVIRVARLSLEMIVDRGAEGEFYIIHIC